MKTTYSPAQFAVKSTSSHEAPAWYLRSLGFARAALLAVMAILITGCAAPRYLDALDPTALNPPADYDMDDPRRLPMFTGDGRAIGWGDLLEAVAWAEIVLMGEQHDDAMAHAVQLAVMQDALDRWPRTLLSMEMLERDHQLLVDDYLDGYLSQEAFVERAGIARWGGREGGWNDWFQPIVDAARDGQTRVIAANAPRRYVRLARLRGYDYLRRMPRERRAMFDLPPRIPHGTYRDRFYDVMLAMRGHSSDDEDENAPDAHDPAHDEGIEAMFRSQFMWDATMARSINRARPSRDRKIVHLVGRFHTDFDGGLVLELRRLRPGARIVTISMAPLDAAALRDEDRNRAEIIIYTRDQADAEAEAETDEAAEGEGNSAGESPVTDR